MWKTWEGLSFLSSWMENWRGKQKPANDWFVDKNGSLGEFTELSTYCTGVPQIHREKNQDAALDV